MEKKISRKIKNNKRYRIWVRDVLEKDNDKCTKCGIEGDCLMVHHIISLKSLINKYDFKNIEEALDCKELFEVNNGLTLCNICHLEEHFK